MSGIKEIREELDACGEGELSEWISRHENDSRQGVRNLVALAKKRLKKTEEERMRIIKMRQFERQFSDCELLCGIDEAGRGPLAGPVTAAAVILPADCEILYVNDSKKLSAKQREALYPVIKSKAVCVSSAMVWPEEIDEINILQATYRAMRKAVRGLYPRPEFLVNDAVVIPDVDIPQAGIVHGDAKCLSIAAASIIAKVERDALMREYDRMYPEYDFASNKGYGSAKHIEALKKYGPCPIHRQTFIQGILNSKDTER